MTHNDQLAIAHELVNHALMIFRQAVLKDQVPTEWDGIEIRQWFADYAASNRATHLLKGTRLKSYKAVLADSNLL